MLSLSQRIFQEAKNKDNPISSAGLILFTLETEIPNKYNPKKAYKYKQPNFTDIKLLTLEQLEKINEILYPEEEKNIPQKKEVSIMDFSKINQNDEKPRNVFEEVSKPRNVFEEASKPRNVFEEASKPRKEIKKMTKFDKLTKHKQKH